MGTRSLTFVYDNERPIINLYRQYDGYPEGHGAEIAEFLSPFTLVNGLGFNEGRKVANGMGCLAGQLVAHFKDGPGQFYLESVESTDCGQDYEYHIYKEGESFRIVVRDRGCNMFGLTMSDKNDSIFEGSLSDFVNFCKEKEMV